MTSIRSVFALFVGLSLLACNKTSQGEADGKSQPSNVTTEDQQKPTSPPPDPKRTDTTPAVGPEAVLGKAAPTFSLKDLDGNTVSLEDFVGKVVVLEWFNPNCPFVKASHTKGSLVDAARQAKEKGVVWLAINSGAPGKQGHGIPANRAGVEQFEIAHPVLLDETGEVGKSYGAERTPHLFLIDSQGLLVYAGAPDNSPDGEHGSPEGGTLVRYLDQALTEVLSSKPVSIAQTKAYGCSVKY